MLRKLIITLLAAAAALAMPLAAHAYEAHHDEQDHYEGVVTKRVVIRFMERDELKRTCGARARACAYVNANVIILPEDEAYGWTGQIVKRIRVKWHDKHSIKELDCDNRYACVRGDIVHARDVSFRHRGIVWLGEAYAEAIGLEYNRRRVELLAHELKHVLTGERHEHS